LAGKLTDGIEIDPEIISTIVSAYNNIKENGITLDNATLTAIVSGIAGSIGDGINVDPAVVNTVVAGVADAFKNGISVDSDVVKALAAGLADKALGSIEIDPEIISTVIGAYNNIKENGITLDEATLAAVVSGIAASIGDGINVDPATVNAIMAAAADAFKNGISVDSATVSAIAAGLAGKLIGGANIDPSVLSAVIAGVAQIKEGGLTLDNATLAAIVSALASKALEGTNFDTGTITALIAAIADVRANGLSLDSAAIQNVIKKMVGNETYAQIRTIICNVTGNYPFKDIANSGYRDSIVEAYYLGLVNGFADGTFRPNQVVTRAQFITMLWRAAGEPKVSGSLKFADSSKIAKDYKSAVLWGVQNGIIQGYNDNTFRPTQNISRAQMATFMYRYMKNVEHYNSGIVKPLTFVDKDMIAAPYVDAVKAICTVGIMNGVSGNKFDPNGTANRGMAATVILRMAKLLDK
ncbi:MAG: S-layer homology domain-containing protein, partial [Bacillota bacterium]|nr:S-layer homology domain-containing protein [Bacillota bacterium]